VFALGVPVLGICYGMQTMAQQLGGQVVAGLTREFGYAEVTVTGQCRLLDGLSDRIDSDRRAVLDVWMSHGDRVTELPDGFVATAASGNAPYAGMSDERRRYYGVQFHPEVTHTLQGARILERFVREICACDALWSVGNIIEDAVQRVRAQTGHGKVLLGLSGGVDSSVVAALLHLAIGDRLVCVFVDHGLLRLGTELGLPHAMVYRHPFPGPGLGVRILGEVRREYADLLRRADAIFIEELRRHDLYDRTSQAFAVFLPVRSVGVMGDGRRYDYVIALRAVETVDFMTAHWARLPYDFLDEVSRRIVNEVPGISRVVYDISGKPPATIEWE
jgi:hypothetical protein